MKTARKLNTLIENCGKLKFGDFILFQEYTPCNDQSKQETYSVSKPIFGIYLGCFPADQTIGMNYIKWCNPDRYIRITNEYVTNRKRNIEVEDIMQHFEWMDYIDILGHWKQKPNWKELLKSYRNLNTKNESTWDEVEMP